MEAMPTSCDPQSFGRNSKSHDEYSNGHDPIIFYSDIPAAQCQANDVGVGDLTAQSGAFWNDLQNQDFPRSAGLLLTHRTTMRLQAVR